MIGYFKRMLGRQLTKQVNARVLATLNEDLAARELERKWHADSFALDIDSRLWRLHRVIHEYSYIRLRRYPNLTRPENFNDRIHWLMLFDQHESMIKCSDKLGVRDFVSKRIGVEFLTELYGSFKTIDELRRYDHPADCVIKTTHDSGTVFVSKKSAPVKIESIASQLESALAIQHGVNQGEWPYAFVQPQILVEERLQKPDVAQLEDIKFHCVNGKVAFIHYICGRGSDPKEIIFTPKWERTNIRLYFPLANADVPRPANLDTMINIAERLAEEFKYVRVDLYNTGERVVVGELTFFPMSGTYFGYGVYEIEPLMRFDLSSRRPPISDGSILFS